METFFVKSEGVFNQAKVKPDRISELRCDTLQFLSIYGRQVSTWQKRSTKSRGGLCEQKIYKPKSVYVQRACSRSNAGHGGKTTWLCLLKWKRNSNIKPAKARTAAASKALNEMQQGN